MAAIVVQAAREHDVKAPPPNSTSDSSTAWRLTDSWGQTDGRLLLIGRNVALPERTLLHELAHAVVRVEFGHGEPWRTINITARETC